MTSLPVVLKGILHPDDARRALDSGVDGIYVSNHGGRQVDRSVAALDALPGVVEAVLGSGFDVPVVFDSGIRCGADAYVALCLGATAVGIGRPHVYGLAIGGALGTVAILLKAEFLLLLIGGVFAAEAVSVILQTSVYKWYKRTRGREYADSHRVFRMAPLHHHFEKLGWAETTVVTRFYILGLLCALVALSTLKVR